MLFILWSPFQHRVMGQALPSNLEALTKPDPLIAGVNPRPLGGGACPSKNQMSETNIILGIFTDFSGTKIDISKDSKVLAHASLVLAQAFQSIVKFWLMQWLALTVRCCLDELGFTP